MNTKRGRYTRCSSVPLAIKPRYHAIITPNLPHNNIADFSNCVARDFINFQKVKIIERKRCGLELGWEGSCRCTCGSLGLLLCSTNAPHLS
jgi:hypothetical protein